MNNQKLLGLFSLKWNPFSPDLPNEALISNQRIDHFCWKIENLVMDGGYGLIVGESGLGKSVALRILSNRLNQLREVKVGTITRPQSGILDFYRELGYLFEIDFKSSNRWAGYKSLREKWTLHIQSTLLRPILLIDEAQEMDPDILTELRFLISAHFDSKTILTVILCGDQRILDKFRMPELVPLGGRIRTRLQLGPATKDELMKVLKESLSKAGNPNLMTSDLMDILTNHASGNYRVLMNMAGELLSYGVSKELHQLDEGLFLELFNPSPKNRSKNKSN
jgi:general secretion pathway protein A